MGAVYDRVIRPLTLVARGIVFGILIATMALILGSARLRWLLVRLLDVYAFGHRAWAARDGEVGGFITLIGLAPAWSQRTTLRRARGGLKCPTGVRLVILGFGPRPA